jgi:predicted nucleotidyltransferase
MLKMEGSGQSLTKVRSAPIFSRRFNKTIPMITAGATKLINHPGLIRDLDNAHQFFLCNKAIRAVWLFGSAVKNRGMDWRSDLDFAVSGLLPGEEYSTWAQLDEILDHQVDLVRLEDASPLLRAEIMKGFLLYEN